MQRKNRHDAVLTLRFSRAAPLSWKERWQQKAFVDFSLWICRLTHSPFSHVDMLTDDGHLLGSSNNPTAPVVSGNPCGVAIRPFDYQRFAVRRDVIMKVTADEKKAFVDFTTAQVGKPFDADALKPSTFLSAEFHNRDWRKGDKWFCAELMARATEEALLLDWDIPGIKNRVTPADLILILAPLFDFEECFKPIKGLEMEPWEE